MSGADFILVGVLLVSAAALALIIWRKSRVLRFIDVSAIQSDRNAVLKGDLIAARLYRKLLVRSRQISTLTLPAVQAVQRGYRRLLERVETIERDYRMQATQREPSQAPETLQRVQALLGEADELRKAQEWEKAEQKYIECISLQPKNAEAFRGLGEVYLRKRDYHHAKETFKHAMKLSPLDAAISLDLVEVYTLVGHHQKALDAARRALVLEPNDPKCLYAVLTTSIVAGNKRLAQATLAKLEQANPENQKLSEYRQQVEDLQSR